MFEKDNTHVLLNYQVVFVNSFQLQDLFVVFKGPFQILVVKLLKQQQFKKSTYIMSGCK